MSQEKQISKATSELASHKSSLITLQAELQCLAQDRFKIFENKDTNDEETYLSSRVEEAEKGLEKARKNYVSAS
jgi:hypothetical protein